MFFNFLIRIKMRTHKEITDDDNYYGYTEEYRIQNGYFRG